MSPNRPISPEASRVATALLATYEALIALPDHVSMTTERLWDTQTYLDDALRQGLPYRAPTRRERDAVTELVAAGAVTSEAATSARRVRFTPAGVFGMMTWAGISPGDVSRFVKAVPSKATCSATWGLRTVKIAPRRAFPAGRKQPHRLMTLIDAAALCGWLVPYRSFDGQELGVAVTDIEPVPPAAIPDIYFYVDAWEAAWDRTMKHFPRRCPACNGRLPGMFLCR